MKAFFKSLLSPTGEVSATRFTQVVGLFMAFTIAILSVIYATGDYVGIGIICLCFIVPQSVTKVMQKKIEVSK